MSIKEVKLDNDCCSAQCSHCDSHIADPEALFCAQCGESLHRDGCCRACGKLLQQHANYCDRCGTPVKATGGEAPLVHAPPHLAASQLSVVPQDEEDERLRRIIDAEVTRRISEAQVDRAAERSLRIEQARQAELLKYGIRESDWLVICEGDFQMGSPVTELDRFTTERQHDVHVGRFEMLKTPVTFDMYDIFCDDVRQAQPVDEGWGRGNRPVINITYWGAMEYCHWLSKRTGANIRLPTEAEWEFACRAGTTTPFWTGETISTEQANFDGGYTYNGGEKGVKLGKTTPVDTFAPNPWGLHDMHGNVWEWCASIFDEEYNGLELEDAGYSDDLGTRVVRGGSWHNVPGGLRSASRNKLRPSYHYLRVGFRVVREIK